MQWYYMKDGQQTGPLDEKAFEVLVHSGAIKRKTQVWNEEMADWQEYSTVAGKSRLRVNKRELATPNVGQKLGRVDPAALVAGTAGRGSPVKTIAYGGFWRRWLATVIDTIVVNLMIVFFIALGVALKMFVYKDTKPTHTFDLSKLELPPDVELPFTSIGYSDQEMYVAIGLLAVMVLSVFFYKPYWTGKTGSTFGKKMLRIKVVRSSGDSVSPGRAFGRYCAEMLSGMFMCFGYLMVAFDKEKRALHDRIADTRVERF